jgi:predicted Zn-dependent protease
VADPLVGQNVYFDKIDGMIYGDKADEGYIRGRTFAHPKLRFAFEVPAGFRLYNQSQAVVARDGDGKAAIQFDRAPKPYSGSMSDYLTRVWASGVRLTGVESITVNGLPAATGAVSGSGKNYQLVALRYDSNAIYRFIFVSASDRTAALNVPFRETTYSFRKLTEAEAAELKPRRLRIYEVRAGDSPAKIAARMPFGDENMKRFLVLNGFSESTVLQPGQRVKIVTE